MHPGQRRVAAVTGGGSGIGEAAAYRLSRDGFDVAVLDINKARNSKEPVVSLSWMAVRGRRDHANHRGLQAP
jgi:NAD(P)-dependent dehydrogenase (short-subunit alcohol dehydrogenase family)